MSKVKSQWFIAIYSAMEILREENNVEQIISEHERMTN